MANWFYYNENGEKVAVTGGQLKGLAKAGVITPDTVVETEEGKTAPARKVKGLTFGEPTQPEMVTSESTTPATVSTDESNPFNISASIPIEQPPQPAPGSFCTYCGQPVQPTAVACTACGADPRVHRKFCYTCGTPLNEVQVICTKCHTPVAGTGSVPIPSVASTQSVAQQSPGASAQLIIELPSKFNGYALGSDYDILIDGQKVGAIVKNMKGETVSGKNIEISVPTGWIKLEVRTSNGWNLIDPVSIDIAAGQKKKGAIRPKPFYWLPYPLAIVFGLILMMVVAIPVCMSVFGNDQAGIIIGSGLTLIFLITLIAIYTMKVPPYTGVIEQEPSIATGS